MRENTDGITGLNNPCRKFTPTKDGGRWCSNCGNNHPAPETPMPEKLRALLLKAPPESPYGFGIKKLVGPCDLGWVHALASHVEAARTELRSAEADEARFAKKVGEWALEDLPEVRVARLEEQIAAAVRKQRRRMV